MDGGEPARCWVVRNRWGSGPAATYDKCIVTSVTAGGVLLACGAQPFLIPATVAS
jgi:hypothetical protein